MISYTKDEMLTATEIVRNFSSVLESISKENKNIVVMKNNKLEAVMLPIKEYEKMSEAVNLLKKLYAQKGDFQKFLAQVAQK